MQNKDGRNSKYPRTSAQSRKNFLHMLRPDKASIETLSQIIDKKDEPLEAIYRQDRFEHTC